jgi:MinD superfamily P-loop ATPase
VLVDADVDAANLNLLLRPKIGNAIKFFGGSLAEIDAGFCRNCGACVPVCRYDAVFPHPDGEPVHIVDPVACDGCGACVYACPHNAITMRQQQEGLWFHSESAYGTLFHAELFAGRENSGKLVTLVRQQGRLFAEENGRDLVIIDGPPGIGCPVISACAGVDLGLVVTEPGLAGLHDLERALRTLSHFKVPAVMCVNKADLSPEGTGAILAFASEYGVEVVGEIPFDKSVGDAIQAGLPVTALDGESKSAKALRAIFERLLPLLETGYVHGK